VRGLGGVAGVRGRLERRDADAQDWSSAEMLDESAPVQREYAPPAPVVPLTPATVPPASSRGADLSDARVQAAPNKS
jgi:hypothetical protein